MRIGALYERLAKYDELDRDREARAALAKLIKGVPADDMPYLIDNVINMIRDGEIRDAKDVEEWIEKQNDQEKMARREARRESKRGGKVRKGRVVVSHEEIDELCSDENVAKFVALLVNRYDIFRAGLEGMARKFGGAARKKIIRGAIKWEEYRKYARALYKSKPSTRRRERRYVGKYQPHIDLADYDKWFPGLPEPNKRETIDTVCAKTGLARATVERRELQAAVRELMEKWDVEEKQRYKAGPEKRAREAMRLFERFMPGRFGIYDLTECGSEDEKREVMGEENYRTMEAAERMEKDWNERKVIVDGVREKFRKGRQRKSCSDGVSSSRGKRGKAASKGGKREVAAKERRVR